MHASRHSKDRNVRNEKDQPAGETIRPDRGQPAEERPIAVRPREASRQLAIAVQLQLALAKVRILDAKRMLYEAAGERTSDAPSPVDDPGS